MSVTSRTAVGRLSVKTSDGIHFQGISFVVMPWRVGEEWMSDCCLAIVGLG